MYAHTSIWQQYHNPILTNLLNERHVLTTIHQWPGTWKEQWESSKGERTVSVLLGWEEVGQSETICFLSPFSSMLSNSFGNTYKVFHRYLERDGTPSLSCPPAGMQRRVPKHLLQDILTNICLAVGFAGGPFQRQLPTGFALMVCVVDYHIACEETWWVSQKVHISSEIIFKLGKGKALDLRQGKRHLYGHKWK